MNLEAIGSLVRWEITRIYSIKRLSDFSDSPFFWEQILGFALFQCHHFGNQRGVALTSFYWEIEKQIAKALVFKLFKKANLHRRNQKGVLKSRFRHSSVLGRSNTP